MKISNRWQFKCKKTNKLLKFLNLKRIQLLMQILKNKQVRKSLAFPKILQKISNVLGYKIKIKLNAVVKIGNHFLNNLQV